MACLEIEEPRPHVAARDDRNGEALFHLGVLYSTGKGVPVNYIEAHKWFNLAAMRGNQAALSWRAELAREMSTDQVAEAQRQARAWLSEQTCH
jgi:TPR repeat protein